jgi:fructose-1-phosphate kinase PfkB-like protein
MAKFVALVLTSGALPNEENARVFVKAMPRICSMAKAITFHLSQGQLRRASNVEISTVKNNKAKSQATSEEYPRF